MIYCISDLHGRYDLYCKMLDKIAFTKEDTLYILGDFVDRGSEGLRILLDVSDRDNVIGLMGNHDFTSLAVLSNLGKPLTPDKLEDHKMLIDVWKMDGGMETYREYKALSQYDRPLALAMLDGLRNCATLEVGDKKFVLCHGGIAGYTEEKPLSDYTIADFAFTREDYSKQKFTENNKFLVTGHTPTVAIEGGEKGRIFHSHDHIAIDCGAVFDFGLGCICLDTMEEYYVK